MIGDCGVSQGDNFGSSVAVVDKLENGDAVERKVVVAAAAEETVVSFGGKREVPEDKRFVTILDGVPDSSNHLI